tara:strand:- start:2574 stop:3671 length:1098 start_codon:yes stop_codon:yes gene_type:complete
MGGEKVAKLSKDQFLISENCAGISHIDNVIQDKVRENQARLTKPEGSLGRLEDLAIHIAGIKQKAYPTLINNLIVVVAADHGIAQQGVSAYPQVVTKQMMANFINQGGAINVLGKSIGARVVLIDAGINNGHFKDTAVVSLGTGHGTDDFTNGPAMTRKNAEKSVATGIKFFNTELKNNEIDIVACGEMGIGNTTAAAALTAAITGKNPKIVTGRGTGIDDFTYKKKLSAIEQALKINVFDPKDAIGLLSAFGGYEIAVMTGIYIGAARNKVPILIDGVISSVSALIAIILEPKISEYLISSHLSPEPAHQIILDRMNLIPLLDLDLRLGEATGAALGLSLCISACKLLNEMATFTDAQVAGKIT